MLTKKKSNFGITHDHHAYESNHYTEKHHDHFRKVKNVRQTQRPISWYCGWKLQPLWSQWVQTVKHDKQNIFIENSIKSQIYSSVLFSDNSTQFEIQSRHGAIPLISSVFSVQREFDQHVVFSQGAGKVRQNSEIPTTPWMQNIISNSVWSDTFIKCFKNVWRMIFLICDWCFKQSELFH